MKRLTSTLKKMLDALAHQDAADFLPIRDKLNTLGVSQKPKKIYEKKPQQAVFTRASNRRIGLLTESDVFGPAFRYAKESALQQQAKIDLLIHADTDQDKLGSVLFQIKEAGIDCEVIQLQPDAGAKLEHYMLTQPSLIFVVSASSNLLAAQLLNEILPMRKKKLPVPLVMIEEAPAKSSHLKSVA